jgi:hypothetical protein
MNLEHVSVEENRPRHRQSYLSGFEESTIFSLPCHASEQYPNRQFMIPRD